MKRTHGFLIALALAFAVVAGTFAALRTTQLGAKATATPRTSDAALLRQARALDRAEAALHKQLAQKPPALPAVPHTPMVATPSLQAAPAPAPTSLASAPAPHVIYVRPKPIVHVIHRHGGEHGDDGGSLSAAAAANGGAGLDD
jgi:hypothetical protein